MGGKRGGNAKGGLEKCETGLGNARNKENMQKMGKNSQIRARFGGRAAGAVDRGGECRDNGCNINAWQRSPDGAVVMLFS